MMSEPLDSSPVKLPAVKTNPFYCFPASWMLLSYFMLSNWWIKVYLGFCPDPIAILDFFNYSLYLKVQFLLWLFVRWKYHTTFNTLKYILEFLTSWFYKPSKLDKGKETCKSGCSCHSKENFSKALQALEFCPEIISSDNDNIPDKTEGLTSEMPKPYNKGICGIAYRLYNVCTSLISGLRQIIWDTGVTMPVSNNLADFKGTLKNSKNLEY